MIRLRRAESRGCCSYISIYSRKPSAHIPLNPTGDRGTAHLLLAQVRYRVKSVHSVLETTAAALGRPRLVRAEIARLPSKMRPMQVGVDINKLNSGKVQIAVFRSRHLPGLVLDYASPEEAKLVALAIIRKLLVVNPTLQKND
jgi:hypothetical protein